MEQKMEVVMFKVITGFEIWCQTGVHVPRVSTCGYLGMKQNAVFLLICVTCFSNAYQVIKDINNE